mmetsp:Transcript_33388/g.78058  ORF Transcript_33388/g.78058 Transcript_33388/m.78058 type:complete len:162 (+) Transcript_33388:3-488(+)
MEGDVFLWMCFFCNNQHRILNNSVSTGTSELKKVFEAHLTSIGQMIIIMNDFIQPIYVTRVWCVFETFAAIENEIEPVIVLPDEAEEKLQQQIKTAGLGDFLHHFQRMDVEAAEASSKSDEQSIKDLIRRTVGFERVNSSVKKKLMSWVSGAVTKFLSEQT